MTQENREREIWKPIIDYEEYEVSNLGRVKRLAFDRNICGGAKQHCKERILSLQVRKHGYMAVMLTKNYKHKCFLVHRLVANAFISNPNNLPQVNHKDEKPSNNCVNNLEWCDQKYNSNYGTSKDRIAEKLRNGILSKPVQQYNINGAFIQEYPSAIEASRTLNLSVSGIVSCCNNSPKYTTCGNFQWKYSNDDKEIKDIRIQIIQLTKDNVQVNIFESITEASKKTGISRTAITNNLSKLSKSAGGYIWKKI